MSRRSRRQRGRVRIRTWCVMVEVVASMRGVGSCNRVGGGGGRGNETEGELLDMAEVRAALLELAVARGELVALAAASE